MTKQHLKLLNKMANKSLPIKFRAKSHKYTILDKIYLFKFDSKHISVKYRKSYLTKLEIKDAFRVLFNITEFNEAYIKIIENNYVNFYNFLLDIKFIDNVMYQALCSDLYIKISLIKDTFDQLKAIVDKKIEEISKSKIWNQDYLTLTSSKNVVQTEMIKKTFCYILKFGTNDYLVIDAVQDRIYNPIEFFRLYRIVKDCFMYKQDLDFDNLMSCSLFSEDDKAEIIKLKSIAYKLIVNV